MDYKDSGVDIDAGDALVEAIKPLALMTKRRGSMGNIGGFGAKFDPKAAGYKDPIIVTSTDGVGTKLLVAIEMGIHDTIGIDLVAMCVNDIIVQGAQPLSFLDYFATGKLDGKVAHEVIQGIANGCLQAACVLAGGETAEMPGMYIKDDYDLAGFAMGAVERDNELPANVEIGDNIYGLKSNGAHSNGYSLIRKIMKDRGHTWDQKSPFSSFSETLGQVFLRPTRIYVRCVMDLHRKNYLKAVAHITGGGITENLPRVLPKGMSAHIENWWIPPMFHWLKDEGGVSEDDMLRTFNCGIGMVLIMSDQHEAQATKIIRNYGDQLIHLGKVVEGDRKVVFQSNPWLSGI